jgi:YVTN family beta-propeller protein
MKLVNLAIAAVCSCLFAGFAVHCAVAAELATQLRRPVALAQSADGERLFVANRDSGSISVIDLTTREVAAEHTIGKRLADLAPLPGSSQLLAVDESAHELLLLQPGDGGVQVVQRLAVSPYPVTICVAADGKQATIASLWSRRLTFVELGETLQVVKVLDLPFAPRCQLLLAQVAGTLRMQSESNGTRSVPSTLFPRCAPFCLRVAHASVSVLRIPVSRGRRSGNAYRR